MATTTASDPHGVRALEDRLLEKALLSLQHQPPEQLSLRSVAQQLGVSHQAPYVHFQDKRAFLAAVAGVGLQRAAERAVAAVAAAGDQPAQQLHALTDAYLEFLRDQPHVHDLANGPLVAKADHPRLQRAAIHYWDLVHDTVAACQPPGVTEAQVLRRCVAVWGTIRGIAQLALHQQIPASVPGDIDDLLHEAVDTLYQGWQSGSSS